MKVQELRKIIKDNNFDVKVESRTNGCIKATSFDVDDLSVLNQVLKNHACEIKVIYAGTKFEHYSLEALTGRG